MTLRPAIREILNRTRLARAELDARLGIMPRGVAKFMVDKDDLLGEGLSDEDLTFLKHADGLRGPYEKIKQAKQLIAEARAEIRTIVGGQTTDKALTIKKPAKTGKVPKIKFSADGDNELTHDERLVLDAIMAAGSPRAEIEDATNLSPGAVKRVLNALATRGFVTRTGAGPATRYLRT